MGEDLDVVSLVVESNKCAHNALEDGPEEEGQEERQVHDVAADGCRQEDEGQAVPIHPASARNIAREGEREKDRHQTRAMSRSNKRPSCGMRSTSRVE